MARFFDKKCKANKQRRYHYALRSLQHSFR